jgi:eukaryotic-like serine/threonine-protein kinase
LRRYLQDEPIRAKRPSLVERVRKWSRRHPDWVAAGVFLLLLSVAGLLVSNRTIAAEKARTQQRAVVAEKRFQKAQQAVDLLVQVCEEELADAPPHLQGVRQRLLESALDYYQDFIEQEQGNAEVQAALAEGQDRVRRILDGLSTLQGAHQLVAVMAPDVQEELELDGEQREKLNELDRRWHEQGIGHFRDSKKFLALAKQREMELAEILDKRQLRRLGQIALQTQGTLPFHQSRVIEALDLTADQKQKIRAIEGTMFSPRHPGPPDRKGHGSHGKPRDDALRNALDRIVQEVLTEEQQARWQKLIGEPFRGQACCPLPPPPGRYGPR